MTASIFITILTYYSLINLLSKQYATTFVIFCEDKENDGTFLSITISLIFLFLSLKIVFFFIEII